MTKKEERELKKQQKLEAEIERIQGMLVYEREYGPQGILCGIDEVGRGPLAGPVVAAAVILPKDVDIYYLNDSKQLSEKKRESLYDEIMEKAIQLADDLGIRVIQLAGYDVYYEEGSEQTRKDFADNLKKAVDMAAVHGVVLGFETMETEFMNTVEKSMQYVKLIDNPYLGVYPDVGNLTNAAKTYGTSVLDDLETGRGHLVAMHLKETVPGKFREIPFLTGHVDFPAVIRKGWQLGVRRFVTEMWDTGKPEWKADICFAHDKMSEILDTME